MSNSEVSSTAVIGDRAAGRAPMISQPVDIAGYQIQERIGVGGYGEVWRAIGPGGFPKAVKILYGEVNGPQAETELKALNLMRELRHPFLLNVERVEHFNGRVVVVTELADRSLDQRFEEASRAGGRGIPRDELLGYLHDAADALDFMSENHGLQHLDIKPENILIQGNHAKIGDFGLTKSVALTRASLINGFTPLYAPPELFEGQACANSDQYSLAIVFQVMLTGVVPFNGRTAAQLASQHLKGTPDLSALNPADRAVVARALSKNANTRFSGCRQFVQELSRRRQVSSASSRDNRPAAVQTVSGLTQVLNPGTIGKSDSTPLRLAVPASPLNEVISETVFRPTLIISVGGLGANVARELRHQLLTQFGGHSLPSIEFLHLDSDKEQLQQLQLADKAAGMPAAGCLLMPLKSSQEYRRTAAGHLSWLSRRWLFNIPRTGNVEGMRPLGRLAFIESQARIEQAISEILVRISVSQAVSESSQRSGFTFSADGFDVCLIGSSSGGTSSGTMIDLGFLVRKLLRKTHLPSSAVSAVVLHATSAGRQNSDTQDANSVSFLRELQFYSLPGNESLRKEAERAAGMPFDTTFFLHMGDDLNHVDYGNSASRISDYLFQWAATAQRKDLELWRRSERRATGTGSELTVRTFGSASIDGGAWNNTSVQAEQLACHLLRYWQKTALHSEKSVCSPSEAETRFGQEACSRLNEMLESLMLSNQRIGDFIPALLRGDIGKRIESYTSDIWKRITQQTTRMSELSELVDSLSTMIGADTGPESSSADSVARIAQTVRQELTARLQQSNTRIRQKLTQDLDSPSRIALASYTLQTLQAATERAASSCSTQKSDVQRAFADLCSSYLQNADESPGILSQTAARSFCQQYCMLLICQTICQCASAHLSSLKDSLNRLRSEILNESVSKVERMLHELEHRVPPTGEIPDPVVRMFDDFVVASGQFRLSSLARPGDIPAQSGAAVVSTAFRFLTAQSEDPAKSADERRAESGGNFPSGAQPMLSNVGGQRRVLALLPHGIPAETWTSRFHAEFGDCVTFRQTNQSELAVFCEVEGIQIPDILESLTSLRPRVAELAERIHTRIDIPW